VTVLRLTQMIERPVEDVFGALISAGDFASWNPTIRASRELTPGDVGDGSLFEWDLRGFGKVRQELREFEQDRRLRLVPQAKFLWADTASSSRISARKRALTTSSR
jgi:uncharacterized protein YndB with AHSA1/START domain